MLLSGDPKFIPCFPQRPSAAWSGNHGLPGDSL